MERLEGKGWVMRRGTEAGEWPLLVEWPGVPFGTRRPATAQEHALWERTQELEEHLKTLAVLLGEHTSDPVCAVCEGVITRAKALLGEGERAEPRSV